MAVQAGRRDKRLPARHRDLEFTHAKLLDLARRFEDASNSHAEQEHRMRLEERFRGLNAWKP